jgi:hypothetical protein
MNVMRYMRAFFKALSMTLRGEKPPAPTQREPQIIAWAGQSVLLLDQIEKAADAQGYSKATRQSAVLEIDRRELSLEMALQTIRHHALNEYPYLLNNYTRYSVMTIQAANLNDQHLVERFAQHERVPAPVRDALRTLGEHLQAIPPATP